MGLGPVLPLWPLEKRVQIGGVGNRDRTDFNLMVVVPRISILDRGQLALEAKMGSITVKVSSPPASHLQKRGLPAMLCFLPLPAPDHLPASPPLPDLTHIVCYISLLPLLLFQDNYLLSPPGCRLWPNFKPSGVEKGRKECHGSWASTLTLAVLSVLQVVYTSIEQMQAFLEFLT